MSWEGLAFQALDGLSSASGLFFVAAGLSLIFGVTRIINIAHGSLYMLGTYIAVHAGDGDGRRARLLGRHSVERAQRRDARRRDRISALAPHLFVAGTVPAAGNVRAPLDYQRCRALAVGTRGFARPARSRIPRRGRSPRPAYADLRCLSYCCGADRARAFFISSLRARGLAGWCARRPKTAKCSARSASTKSVLFTAVFALGSLLAGLGGALQVAREPADLGPTSR